ncbi:NEW3 domain-containing protein [Streptomyces sp. CL7]|uniref:NEW3 domain-containing protein n=1 Tax=Streptomyces sp. CL7 TaxID=3096006 RepID=UPI002A749C27|nr:NEW3 domain-containing protein [Streptomyces sp. CL7]WPP33835.1 NEW3 domain-containing protein [Streptomyces sp. CL7]
MHVTRWVRPLRAVAVAASLAFVAASAATAADTPADPPAARTEVSVSPVDLDGPAISTVTVRVKNAGPQRMRSLKVTFAGPVGWAVQPSMATVSGSLAVGAFARAEFRIRVPEKRPGFVLRTFTATAMYDGGDGAGSATGTRTEVVGSPLPDLAAAYDNVGVTDESDTAPGDYDGDGNSFSAQKPAAVGLTPGGAVRALGAELTWPEAEPGTPGNVSSAGQAITLGGRGSKLLFLGSGVGSAAPGTATVHYTDGTSSRGRFGFPNWSFDPAGLHGASLVASADGRNRPDGYGNAGIAYRIFAHSVPLDASKEVAFVVLPSNGNVHVFAMAVAP